MATVEEIHESGLNLTALVRDMVKQEIARRASIEYEFDTGQRAAGPEPLEHFIMNLIAQVKPVIIENYKANRSSRGAL